MVGFQDHSHFGKVFRRIVGVTPQEYRTSEQKPASEETNGAFSTFEYSNVHPFNPQFGGTPKEKSKLIM